MSNYHFRVRFQFPHDRALDSDEQSIDIPLLSGRGTYVISAVSGYSLKESQWLLIKDVGDGFVTEGEAAEAGRHVKNAVMWWSTKERVGVDVGEDTTNAWVTQYVIDRVREEEGIRLINELHGLQVYEEEPELPTRFVAASMEPKLLKSTETFRQDFHTAVDRGLEFTERETLAFELYGLSHFEAAERARFVTLISAIESISDNKGRSPAAVEHVEKLIELTRNSGLPKPEIDSMVDNLKWQRQESISKTGRDLVDRFLRDKEYGGKTAKPFFHHCYGVRSDLVHYGKPLDANINLRALVNELDRLVADLLLASAGRSEPQGFAVQQFDPES
jgi:hypothetical protein